MKIQRVESLSLSLPILAAYLVALTILLVPASASASRRNGKLRITKECSHYTGLPGSVCTITRSNLSVIPAGSQVFYDQAAGVPAGLLDSNVVLDAGNGDRAFGRCSLDGVTNRGLCTFSDGTGKLAGFHARVEVSPASAPPAGYHWRGTYGFAEADKEHGDR
jgi:hypothetical protein